MENQSGLKSITPRTTQRSVSETGHAINVANFETMISYCEGYGEQYDPNKNSIKMPQLKALHVNANLALQPVNTAKTALDIATNARETIFEPLKKLATRVVNALEATDALPQTIDDAKTVNRKIQGKRANNATPADSEMRTISVAQLSYDGQLENFGKLIDVVAAEPTYSPNEDAVKVETLNTLLDDMRTSNSNVINANTPYSNARIARNNVLYAPETGLCDIAANVKAYVKSLYGAASPQYKQISGIKFTRIK